MKKQNVESQGEFRLFVERKAIEGFPGYEVTSDGRVWSKERMVRHSRGGLCRVKGKWLKAGVDGKGYLRVDLCNEGVKKTAKIHVLVAKAFLGPRPDGMQVDHVDRDRKNNRIENLRYVTSKANHLNNSARGVCFDKREGKWLARVGVNGKLRNLGYYDSESDALKVRRAAHAEALEEALMESRLRSKVVP